MITNLLSPLLWQSVPFQDEDSFLDFMGVHDQWHRILATSTKTRWRNLDDLKTELQPHAEMHDDLADSLGLSRVADLVSYDLTNKESFISFMQANALDHQRLRAAAGL